MLGRLQGLDFEAATPDGPTASGVCQGMTLIAALGDLIDIKKERIDMYTMKMLKRGKRYKLFKLDIGIGRLMMFYKILDDFPHLEICNITMTGCKNITLDALTNKSMFQTK